MNHRPRGARDKMMKYQLIRRKKYHANMTPHFDKMKMQEV